MDKLQKTGLLLLMAPMFINNAIAQANTAMDNKPVEMADAMRSNGKIYVVVAVLTTVLLGMVLYLLRLEKRIKQMEKETTAA